MADETTLTPLFFADLPLPDAMDAAAVEWADKIITKAEGALPIDQQNSQSAPENLEKKQRYLSFIKEHSPYLTQALERYPEIWGAMCTQPLPQVIEKIYQRFEGLEVAVKLRRQKQQLALALALADIAGYWDWEQVTAELSNFAVYAVETALDSLLQKAVQQRALSSTTEQGIFILGMGKLGGGELNYSSDIDLIILFDPERLSYSGRQSSQNFMTRLAQELTALLQDRTTDGYVFRTDLRLRPDPSSTPLAVSTKAALRYYESVGQNWERAAMIKARVVAGDRRAGEAFLKELQPFMWRTHLDYAAVADILSIKRQMQSLDAGPINPFGHNVKTGRGGIREIEFLAQIFQLIRGGRDADLRIRKTVHVLDVLVQHGHLERRIAGRLKRSYAFFRTLEHRLQMQADQQTHTLPDHAEGMEALARFMGFTSTSKFERTISRHLRRVHHHFTRAFETTAAPLSGGSKLVFTGVEHDPETLNELRKMGFHHPETISSAVQDWHKGNRRATRTKRSRELLTELVPEILSALAASVNPDEAFASFDAFMTHLPSGVQLFSLFASNRVLLNLTAEIMGSAPSLGKTLSQNPSLFDAVLSGYFFEPLPTKVALMEEQKQWLHYGRDEEEKFLRLSTFQKEKFFQCGVQMLKSMTNAVDAGYFLSDLAECVIAWVVESTKAEFSAQYGQVEGAGLLLVGLGKLGSRELTFGSDLDLNFLYDAPEEALSDGPRPLHASAYFNRLAQRIVGRLTALTHAGRLYDVDTRLRPFGQDGPMAVSLTAFARYHKESAWLFERLALTRARVIVGEEAAAARLKTLLRALLSQPVPAQEVASAILDMRRRIEETFQPHSQWDVKHRHGGLMDCDFMLQYHILCLGDRLSERSEGDLRHVPELLQKQGLMTAQEAEQSMQARALQTTLLFYLRLCSHGDLDAETAPNALKKLLAHVCGEADFSALAQRLDLAQAYVRSQFKQNL